MFVYDDLDPDDDDTNTDNGDNGDDTAADDSTTDDNSQQSDDDAGDDDDRDWEASYKGLQRASEKKRNELESQLAKAKTNLESTTTELEEAKSDSGSLETKQKEAAEAKEKLENEVQTLQDEHGALEKKIKQQTIVMSEFPHLAPVAKFIPIANDEEGYRKGAEELSTAINTMIDDGVKTSLDGSSATFKTGEEEEITDSDNELDEAWDTVYATAGNPEKLEEYNKAFAKIREADPNAGL